MDDKLSDS